MKSVISSLIIFILIIILSTAAGFYVNNVIGQMLQSVYENEKNIAKSSWDEIEEETEKLIEIWGKNKSLMLANYNHSLVDGVNSSIVKLKNTAKMRRKEDFVYENSNLSLMLKNLVEQQKINFGNIF